MSQKTANSSNQTGFLSHIEWERIAKETLFFITRPIIEAAHGIRSKRVPQGECILWADIVGIAIYFHVDQWVFQKVGISKLYPTQAWTYYLYAACALFSGFWMWGLYQTVLRGTLISRLTEVFSSAGLKNSLGRFPAFIFDRPVDQFTRKLRLRRSGFSMDQFEKAKAALESGLQVYIDEVRENREQGTIDLVYSHSPMPTQTTIDGITKISPLTFVVGKTRAKQITASLQKVPHLMVAGQTGGGKSTFLRGLIATLFLNNKNFHFTLIDLKGGLEFQTFENLPRVKVIPSVQQAISSLEYFGEALKERMALLKANEAKDIDAYLAIPESQRKIPDGISLIKDLNRHLVIVDEAAEMFLAGSHANGKEIQTARKILSQIARQGRSVGVHLVIATQRPDAHALDPQVKANLTGVICFQMLNDASSITVLGTGRATELPPIPGRAIWKCGAEMLEVQTPYLATQEADRLLESHRSSTSPTQEK